MKTIEDWLTHQDLRPSECRICDPLVTWCAHVGDQAVQVYSPESIGALNTRTDGSWREAWHITGPGILGMCGDEDAADMFQPHHHDVYLAFHDTETEARADFDRRAALMRNG